MQMTPCVQPCACEGDLSQLQVSGSRRSIGMMAANAPLDGDFKCSTNSKTSNFRSKAEHRMNAPHGSLSRPNAGHEYIPSPITALFDNAARPIQIHRRRPHPARIVA
jgi:hypothetical protein